MKQLFGLSILLLIHSSPSFAGSKASRMPQQFFPTEQPYQRMAECLGSIANPIYKDPASTDSRIYQPTYFGTISDSPDSGYVFMKKNDSKIYFISKYEIKEKESGGQSDPLRSIKRSAMNPSKEDVFSGVIIRKFAHLSESLKYRYENTYLVTGGVLSIRQLRNIKEGMCTCMKSGIALREIASAREEISGQRQIQVRFEDGVRPLQREDLECVSPVVVNNQVSDPIEH